MRLVRDQIAAKVRGLQQELIGRCPAIGGPKGAVDCLVTGVRRRN